MWKNGSEGKVPNWSPHITHSPSSVPYICNSRTRQEERQVDPRGSLTSQSSGKCELQAW